MNTEAKVLHIRRAAPLDAVNILRLIVDEEKRAQVRVALDDATRLMDIITAITTGYVSVAEISGRIVGTIGALVSDLSGRPVLSGTFFALSPSFHDTPVAGRLVSGLVKVAQALPVTFALPNEVAKDRPYGDALRSAGFEPKRIVWGYEGQEINAGGAEPDEAGEPADVPDDQGFDAESGAADGDDVADGDALPDFAAARPAAQGA